MKLKDKARSPFYAIIYKFEDKYFLAATSSGKVQGFSSKKKALSFFEDVYESCHAKGFESSMSACIHIIHFNPKVVKFKNLQQVQDIFSGTVTLCSLASISGFAEGFKFPDTEGAILWEKGEPPRLIFSPEERLKKMGTKDKSKSKGVFRVS
jgi:hypothetical protein